MPHVSADDDVKLYYEESGEGEAIVFVHELAGDHRSWEPQVRYFSRRYRCVTFNARGYPPSDVPDDVESYSQARVRDDVKCVLDHLKITRAHVVGLSMGSYTTLNFGIAYPQMARSLVVAGCGHGSEPEQRETFQAEIDVIATRLVAEGMESFSRPYAVSPSRVRFRDKDRRGWQEFADQLAGHSALGTALTLRGVQKMRPTVFELEAELKTLAIPTLIMSGDEDEPCLLPGVFLKRTIASAGFLVMAQTGHTLNLEEPDGFNRALADFFAQVETGRWLPRDLDAAQAKILGSDADGESAAPPATSRRA